MSTLLVGFDSAWTPANRGALVGALHCDDRRLREFGDPVVANFETAERMICEWQLAHRPDSTVVLLDQPTIVPNLGGQRPVENVVSSVVSRRRGGIQPANKARIEMFGEQAPVWAFLARFGGAADLSGHAVPAFVVETYPVLAMIAFGWTLPDARASGRLPKYNPARKKTFSQSDWGHVCRLAALAFEQHGLAETARWLHNQIRNPSPRKSDQDSLDACLCLLVALHLVEDKDGLVVGNQQTGYIVVPDNENLRSELKIRCVETRREPADWIRTCRFNREGAVSLSAR